MVIWNFVFDDTLVNVELVRLFILTALVLSVIALIRDRKPLLLQDEPLSVDKLPKLFFLLGRILDDLICLELMRKLVYRRSALHFSRI